MECQYNGEFDSFLDLPLIAATARAHEVPLYSRNRKDFEPFAGLIEIRSA